MLDAPADHDFSDWHVRLATCVGLHVDAVVRRVTDAEERELHLRRADSVQQLLTRGAATASVSEAGRALAEVARESLGTEFAAAYLFDGNNDVTHVVPVNVGPAMVAVVDQDIVGASIEDFLLLREVFITHGNVFVSDARDSDLLPSELLDKLALRSYAALPLISARGVHGVVVVADVHRTRTWTQSDRAVAERLSQEGALVVENAMLRAAEHERMVQLSHRTRQLSTVARHARRMSVHDNKTVLSVLVEAVTELGFDAVIVGPLDEEGSSVPRRVRDADRLLRTDALAITGGWASSGQPAQLIDGPERDALLASPGGAHVVVASIGHDGADASLIACRTCSTPPDRTDIEALDLLATQAGRALHLADQFETTQKAVERLAEGSTGSSRSSSPPCRTSCALP